MEEAGRIRRGYFIAGFGAAQFASAGALDLLRSFRDEPDEPETLLLAATDPANPYGALLKWPAAGLMRVAGSSVVLVNGALAAYLARGEKNLDVFLPEDEPLRGMVGREVSKALASLVTTGVRRALLLKEVTEDAGPFLVEAGFVKTAMGYQLRSSVGAGFSRHTAG
jgi:ATP-dependent Lhr-like helicase